MLRIVKLHRSEYRWYWVAVALCWVITVGITAIRTIIMTAKIEEEIRRLSFLRENLLMMMKMVCEVGMESWETAEWTDLMEEGAHTGPAFHLVGKQVLH